LNGVIAMPATAAHERDFKFAGNTGTGDSVIGPVTSVKSIAQCFREARALSDAVLSSGGWSLHVFHNNGSDRFQTLVHDRRNPRTHEYADDFVVDSSGFVGDSKKISASIAGVRLSDAGLGAFVTSLASAYDPGQTDIFVVIGCADRHEIDVVLTSGIAPPPTKKDASLLRFVFDQDGSKIESQDRVLVRVISKRKDGEHIRWTCQFADDRTADVWIHESVFCGNGVDLTPRCRIGEMTYEVAGGKVKSMLDD
jgi:hypothetical protein